MTREEAHAVVEKYLRAETSGRLAILPDLTKDEGDVWVVHVNSTEYVDSRDDRTFLFGLGVFLVLKSNATLYRAGSALSVTKNLELFRQGSAGGPQTLDHETSD